MIFAHLSITGIETQIECVLSPDKFYLTFLFEYGTMQNIKNTFFVNRWWGIRKSASPFIYVFRRRRAL